MTLGLVSLLALVFAFSTEEGRTFANDLVDGINNLSQVVEAPNVNRSFTLAGELLPDDFDVKERLDRELLVNSYWQSNTMINLKRANRYFPTIERILREQGVPDDFKYLAVAESNLSNVVSPAKAKGFWQFRKLAAKEFGLEVNDEVDERYHLEKSTEAAAKYIKQLKNRFGTWTDAAASYNMGPTNYSKVLKNQGEDSYFDLNVGTESSRYVFRIVAIKEIMSNPNSFGFYPQPGDLYQELNNVYEIKVDSSVSSWKKFATQHGVSYRELKIYNPWLRDNKLTVKKNTYFIKIPKQ